MDGEKGNGPFLKDKYHIQGFPTTIVADANGEEIDRIVGYLPPKEFIDELERIRKNLGTISSMEKELQKNPGDIEMLKALAEKYEDKGDLSSAMDAWKNVADLDETLVEYAKLKSAQYRLSQEGKIDRITDFITSFPESEYLPTAYSSLVKHFKQAKAHSEEAEAYKKLTDLAIKMGKDSYSLLNGYAWRMTELDLYLNDALEKVRRAVSMIEEKETLAIAQVMDTEAEVLWKLGKIDDAVMIIDKCIALQPDDDYYLKQKNKFLEKE